MKKMSFVLFCALLALPLVADSPPPCTSPHGCVKCKEAAPHDACITVKIDANCRCQLTIPNPYIVCASSGVCDYTGPPPCANPTPNGECFAVAFAPSIPNDKAPGSGNNASETESVATEAGKAEPER